MKLATIHGKPVDEILNWPQSQLRLWAAYLARERAPWERVEIAVAQLCALFANVNRKKGSKALTTSDFLLFKDAWDYRPETGDANLDDDISRIIQVFGKDKLIINRPQ